MSSAPLLAGDTEDTHLWQDAQGARWLADADDDERRDGDGELGRRHPALVR